MLRDHAHLYRLHNFRSSCLLAENHFKTVTRENWHDGTECLIFTQSTLTGSLKIWISDLYLVTIFCFGRERRQVKRFVLTEDNGILPRPCASLTRTDQSNEPHIFLHCLSVFFSRRPQNNLVVEPWMTKVWVTYRCVVRSNHIYQIIPQSINSFGENSVEKFSGRRAFINFQIIPKTTTATD